MSEVKQLLNIIRIYLDNPNDKDMERALESYSNKNNTVKLYHKIKQLEKENAELRELLGEILCVPTTADEASRPANFDPNITGHRQSLIVNLSVSYDRLYRIQKKLEEQGK